MPNYTYKCDACGFTNDYIVGGVNGKSAPTLCTSCNAENTMKKQFSAKGVSGEVVGGFDYEYGRKSWKRTASIAEKGAILAGEMNPY
jgi:putative FmdB family regulatory protein